MRFPHPTESAAPSSTAHAARAATPAVNDPRRGAEIDSLAASMGLLPALSQGVYPSSIDVSGDTNGGTGMQSGSEKVPFQPAIREFGAIRLDSTGWPIIVMDFPEKRVADSALRGALEHIEALLQGGPGKSFQITDLTRIREIAPATQRRLASEWMERTAPLHRQFSVGGANVTPSALIRGMVTAVHWFKPPPTPTSFCATREEALTLAVQALRAANVAIPPDLAILRGLPR